MRKSALIGLMLLIAGCAASPDYNRLASQSAAVEVDTDNNNAIDVPYGGTNADTAAGARSNLDVYSKDEADAADDVGILSTAIDSFSELLSQFDITGTPDGTKFIRDDGVLATPAGGAVDMGAWGASSEITLVSGVAALSGEGYYTIDTESDGATDDLTQITGLVAGDEIVICAEHNDRTVIVKAGTYFYIETDFILNNTRDRMTLQCIGSNICVELSRRSGGD